MTNLELLQKSSKKQIGSFFVRVGYKRMKMFSRCYSKSIIWRNDALFSRIASGGNCAVVLVNCFPTPEAQYPIPIEEAYAATKWIAENENAIGVDISKLAVCGDSVGGNMSIAVTIIYKEQCLFYPITDVSFNTKSCVWREPTASPLRAPMEVFKGMPPALVIIGEFDVLRDEGENFAKKLIEAGVTVTVARYLGTIHDFVMLNALAQIPTTKAAIAQACVLRMHSSEIHL
uniref:Alpha/beta hydrolase fold-3 domain-containing protein n=1 Tax=Physcomitrium patens TaxID=3218 RepID=A0A2K1L7B8_PHYPA|nr:hypothetical protein PHYPA_000359 [Physcomitrium patens]